MTRLVSLIRTHFNVSKKKNSMCTLHIENPSNSVSVQAIQKTHKIISFFNTIISLIKPRPRECQLRLRLGSTLKGLIVSYVVS